MVCVSDFKQQHSNSMLDDKHFIHLTTSFLTSAVLGVKQKYFVAFCRKAFTLTESMIKRPKLVSFVGFYRKQ